MDFGVILSIGIVFLWTFLLSKMLFTKKTAILCGVIASALDLLFHIIDVFVNFTLIVLGVVFVAFLIFDHKKSKKD